MNQTQYNARLSLTSYRSNDIDFDTFKRNLEADISKSWIGFQYLKELEQRRDQVVSKIEKYISKLTTDNGNLILYCEFTFNHNLDLLIKSSDIRKDFIEQLPPNVNPGVKINQPDLLSALTQIKDYMYKESSAFKEWLLKNQNCKGDIWSQAEWILQNNNQKEGDKYLTQVEKHRKNMMATLINSKIDQDQCMELQSYLLHYYQYFDQLSVNSRNQIYDLFLIFLGSFDGQEEQKRKHNQLFRNNQFTIQANKIFFVNIPGPPQFQISIPKFLWSEILKSNLQGYIISKMIENQELNLNFQVIEKIFLSKLREQQQRFPQNVAKRK
ncbi:unnamed protein product [Paramecium octaurelia]|uniref:Uncharacterized protein n=1 Tax=Paramecium octaurelia TaxID=43137 RepID=A0A8S1TFU3_PAROT|nr:unnamed protein product [Paramecium octaurelia]